MATFAFAGALTGAVRKLALARGIIDHPNARSSHLRATPRGGGAAIVLTVSLALICLYATDQLSPGLFRALAAGGLLIAGVGLVDDWRGLSPAVRLLAHALAAIWVVWCVGPLHESAPLQQASWIGAAGAVLAVVWMVNLFNFMDGIDGLAAVEGLTVALGGGALAMLSGHVGTALVAGVLAFACAGFLCWNWPPARIFLGDVGSGYLGYVIAVLALDDSRGHPHASWIWLILAAVFVVDATLTLLLRLARGERIYEAHRQHAYQRQAQRWNSHRRVTAIVLIINVIWLFPLALVATLRPDWTAAMVGLALFPLVLVVYLAAAAPASMTRS